MQKIKKGAVIWARKTLESEIFLDKPAIWFKMWFYIVMMVYHENGSVYKRGEGLFTYKQISQKTQASRHQVDKFLRFLKKRSMIESKQKKVGMLIKINKYNAYQKLSNYYCDGTDDDTVEARSKLGRNHIEKNEKNEKNERRARNNIDIDIKHKIPPPLDAVCAYATELKLTHEEANAFYDHFTSNGWKVSGKTPMKDWRAALRNWERRSKSFKSKKEEVDGWQSP